MSVRVRVLLLASFWMLCSCATAPKRPGPPMADDLRQRVITSLQAGSESRRAMRGFATVRFGPKILGLRGETTFVVQCPDGLRIDGLTDFGTLASQFAMHDGSLTIVWPLENVYFRGAASPKTLERFLRAGVTPEEAVRILLGNPSLEEAAGYAVRASSEELVKLRSERQEIWVERRGDDFWPVRWIVYDVTGRRRYDVRYEGRRLAGPASGSGGFAERLDARFARGRLRVEFRDVELNPKVKENLFQITIPDDAERIAD